MKIVKVISLWQPWATLGALNEKMNETRNWKPGKDNPIYKEPFFIHAAKRIDKEICEMEPYKSVLAKYGYNANNLPAGVILAKSNLMECLKVVREGKGHAVLEDGSIVMGNEYYFGEYTQGRYAWKLKDTELLKDPISAKGQQRLWNFELKFYQLFKNGMVAEDKIDDYIDKWHDSDSSEALHEYLGMLEEQYVKWVKDGVL